MASEINTAFMKLSKRAETSARGTLIDTFVDAGPLFTLLSGKDHQVLYGRRGTGKTHALTYLADKRESEGDAVIYVDLRQIGSTGGLYSDSMKNLAERATTLLIDVVQFIHEGLLDFCVSNDKAVDLSQAGPILDNLAETITEIRVVGTVSKEAAAEEGGRHYESDKTGFTASTDGMGFSLENVSTTDNSHIIRVRKTEEGREIFHVQFGRVGATLRKVAELFAPHAIWVLLDEWSSIPVDLQSYFADFLRRSFFPVSGVVVKIGAIEQRSQFCIPGERGDYVGIELGADAAANINLDDFMVFDSDAVRAKAFLSDLIYKHFISVASEEAKKVVRSPDELIGRAFTRIDAFEEFVRSSEGVPRDAINILSNAANAAMSGNISISHVRKAASAWFQRDKAAAIRSNPEAEGLLHWIIDEVIGKRRARAFLLRSNVTHHLIDSLFDSRVLHILKRTIATHDQPGVRYDVYKLDYGCYVNLHATERNPEGLLPFDDEDGKAGYIEVPPDDYRSIRRAILSLEEFENRAISRT